MPSRRQKNAKDIAIAKARREGRPADSYRHEASNAQAQQAMNETTGRDNPLGGFLGNVGQTVAKVPAKMEHLKEIILGSGKQVEDKDLPTQNS